MDEQQKQGAARAVRERHILEAAQLAYHVNRAYRHSIGEADLPLWSDAPRWHQESMLKGSRETFERLDRGEEFLPALIHDAWLAYKRAEGWSWGPVMDSETKQHPCFMPYESLPAEQKTKDFLFRACCEAMYKNCQAELEDLDKLAEDLSFSQDIRFVQNEFCEESED